MSAEDSWKNDTAFALDIQRRSYIRRIAGFWIVTVRERKDGIGELLRPKEIYRGNDRTEARRVLGEWRDKA